MLRLCSTRHWCDDAVLKESWDVVYQNIASHFSGKLGRWCVEPLSYLLCVADNRTTPWSSVEFNTLDACFFLGGMLYLYVFVWFNTESVTTISPHKNRWSPPQVVVLHVKRWWDDNKKLTHHTPYPYSNLASPIYYPNPYIVILE